MGLTKNSSLGASAALDIIDARDLIAIFTCKCGKFPLHDVSYEYPCPLPLRVFETERVVHKVPSRKEALYSPHHWEARARGAAAYNSPPA